MKSKIELKEIDIKNSVCYYFNDIINDRKMYLILFHQKKNYMKIFQFITFRIKLQQIQNY